MNNPYLAILVNHLWQSTLFVAAIWGLARMLRRNSARVRYWLWLAASLKFLLPFAILAAVGTQIPWHAPAVDPGPATPAIVNIAADLAAPMTGDIPYPAPRTASRDRLEQIDKILTFSALILWFVGALFVMIRWAVRWIEIQLVLRKSTAIANVDFPAPVRTTEKQFEPGVVGIFRPKLLLPAGIEGRLTQEQMLAVLAHERCHLRWRDNFTASLHMLVETIFWFFPPVWWIGARLIEERERACDEQVVRDGHAPRNYAEGLLNVCEHYIASRLPCVSGVSGSDLRKRVENIIKRTLGVRLDGPRKLILIAATCCAVAAPLAAGMVAGSTMQVLFSLSPGSAAMEEYFLAGIASSRSSLVGRSGINLALYTCPDADPGLALLDRQRNLAAMVARMPPSHERALFYAVAANSRTEVQRLLAAGAPRNGDLFMRGNSLMGIAAEFADVPMLELLTNAGFDVGEQNTHAFGVEGRTPLLAAISAGRLRNARWLIAHGADASAMDKYQQSPLTVAMASCRDKDLVALLLKAGARPDFKALRIADSLGFDLRTDATMQGPPLQQYRPPLKGSEVSADLDGDGVLDHAAIYQSIDDKREVIFVMLSSRKPGEWIRAADGGVRKASSVSALTFEIAKPGTYATACAKGYGKPCSGTEPATVALQHGGIRFLSSERPGSVFYWDNAEGRFKAAWTLDKER